MRLLIASMALIALVGCQKKDEPDIDIEGTNTISSNTAAPPSSFLLKPALWETVAEASSMDVPGFPREMTDATLADLKAHPPKTSVCVTDKDVLRPPPAMFAGNDGACEYQKFAMADGKIDAVIACTTKGGHATITISGSYGPDNITVASTNLNEGQMTSTVKGKMTSRPVGDCPATK